MKVFLDGHQFELKSDTGVIRTPLVDFPANIRLDGQQQRKDRTLLSSWAIDRWSGGLGIERLNVDVASSLYRYWDAENVDTRWSGQIILSPAFNTVTPVPSRGDVNVPLLYSDDLYFIESANTGGSESGYDSIGVAYKFVAPNTLGSNVNLGIARGSFGVGSVSVSKAFGLKIVAVAHIEDPNVGREDRVFHIASLGAVASYHYDLNQQAGAIKPKIEDLGGTPHILHYSPEKETVQFVIGDDALTTYSTVASLSAVIGSYLAPLETDGLTMYAQLPQGVYNFDATPAKIIDTQRSMDKNVSQVLFQNYLHFKNKYSLMRYDGTDVLSVGYDLEDGLPSDKWGQITAQTSTWKYLFAAVRGATYSHILTMDRDYAWQYYARMPSPDLWVRDMFLSDSPDGYDRLWCIYGNYGKPGYFLNPMVNPLQAATYSFVGIGDFTPPIFDGGMGEEKGAFYDITLTTDKVNPNAITVAYALDGATSFTDLGTVATTTETLVFGSPYGLEGYRIQPRFTLSNVAVAGTTPVFRQAIIHYLKDPDKRESFDFTVDLERTARDAGKPVEAILGTLSAIMNKKPLMPFQYGQVATKAVKVLDIPSSEEVEEDRVYGSERIGEVRIKVAEIR